MNESILHDLTKVIDGLSAMAICAKDPARLGELNLDARVCLSQLRSVLTSHPTDADQHDGVFSAG